MLMQKNIAGNLQESKGRSQVLLKALHMDWKEEKRTIGAVMPGSARNNLYFVANQFTTDDSIRIIKHLRLCKLVTHSKVIKFQF